MRMRFKPDERAAFVKGAAVEWRNGRYWYSGEVMDGVIHKDDPIHWLYVRSTHHNTGNGFVRYGEVIHCSPTHIRVPE